MVLFWSNFGIEIEIFCIEFTSGKKFMLTGTLKGDLQYHLRNGSIIIRLIIVNVAVFLVYGLLAVLCFLISNTTITAFLSDNLMAYSSWSGALQKPWTIFTYQIFHISLFHIFFNMLWLYWFGEIFILYVGEKKIFPLYLAGGLFGWLIFALAMNYIPALSSGAANSRLLGASAGIMAIVFGAVAIRPDHELRLLFIGNIKILYVALISLVLDLLAVPQGGAGTYFSHLGGALFGYGYVKLWYSGTDLFAFIDTVKNWFKPKSKVKSMYVNRAHNQREEKLTDETQKKLDDILDKISRSGYDSLTQQEKNFLFQYSKNS